MSQSFFGISVVMMLACWCIFHDKALILRLYLSGSVLWLSDMFSIYFLAGDCFICQERKNGFDKVIIGLFGEPFSTLWGCWMML